VHPGTGLQKNSMHTRLATVKGFLPKGVLSGIAKLVIQAEWNHESLRLCRDEGIFIFLYDITILKAF